MVCSLPGSSVHEDSPDRNTRVGCHALLQGISATQGLNPGLPHCRWILYQLSYQGNSKSQIVLYSPWNSPGQNTGVHSLSLLQGIFPTQGLNPGLPQSRQNLYQQSYKGSLRILEWVAIPSPANLPSPGIRTGVSCFATLAYQLSCQGSPGMNNFGSRYDWCFWEPFLSCRGVRPRPYQITEGQFQKIHSNVFLQHKKTSDRKPIKSQGSSKTNYAENNCSMVQDHFP